MAWESTGNPPGFAKTTSKLEVPIDDHLQGKVLIPFDRTFL